MKNTQLLSVVFSLIMVTGVTAGNTSFADSDDLDDVIEDFEDCVDAGGTIGDNPNECTLDGKHFVNHEDDDDADENVGDDKEKVLVCHKNEKTMSIGADALDTHLAHGDYEGHCDGDARADFHDGIVLDDLLDDYCKLTDEDKRQLFVEHPRLAPFTDKLANYCDLPEDEQDVIDESIKEYGDKIRHELKSYSDEYFNKGTGNLRDHLAVFCDMTAEERAKKLEIMHDDLHDDLKADHLRYCEMSEDQQNSFRDRLMDRMSDHMEDREVHHDDDRKHEGKEKFSDMSNRLKAMIMDKRDISDERYDEIKMKFEAKFGEDSEKKKSEIKIKYKDHMLKMKYQISDERKSDIHDRLAEMKSYKAELREKSSELSDEKKQQLREKFIEKAKNMQLAWISPRIQITAGVDPTEVECREGYILVMKTSNGVPLCLQSDTALKMIDREFAVPAN